MSIVQTFRLAFKSIISNKMRSFLTMLGMFIGVAAVIAMVAAMNGVTDRLISQFDGMGVNHITVTFTNSGTRKVTEEEVYDLVESNPEVFSGLSPNVSGKFTLKNGTASLTRSVEGVAENYAQMKELNLSAGRFISYADIVGRQATCVVGSYIVQELFETDNVVGETIKIDGENFTIVGILEETEDSEENSADDCIYAPYSKVARMSWTGEITTFTVAAIDTEHVTEGEKILDDFLYEKLKDEDLYNVITLTSLIETITEMTTLMGVVFGGIAGISLLVAGIGIMNIMLVSVSERTVEIGIRKSLGAKRKDIMLQFIIEAAVISALGGLVGIVIGVTGADLVGDIAGINATPSVATILVAFGVSAGIGLLFGYAPASKAAKLNPIDALRSE